MPGASRRDEPPNAAVNAVFRATASPEVPSSATSAAQLGAIPVSCPPRAAKVCLYLTGVPAAYAPGATSPMTNALRPLEKIDPQELGRGADL